MATTYKDILITPFRGDANNNPYIRFSSGDVTTNADINVWFYPTTNGTLSFEGSAGQLLSITNDLTGTIFSVNDVSGIPSLEIDANGKISLAHFGGNVGIGTSNPQYKLDVVGAVNASSVLINGSPISSGGAYFQGNNGDVGSATGLGDIFRVHTNTLTANVTIYSGNNALAAGPITIQSGKSLTIQDNARVAIV